MARVPHARNRLSRQVWQAARAAGASKSLGGGKLDDLSFSFHGHPILCRDVIFASSSHAKLASATAGGFELFEDPAACID